MEDLFVAIISAPVGSILIIAGIFFIGIAIVGNVKSINPDKTGRIAAGLFGTILFGIGFAMIIGWINMPVSNGDDLPEQVDLEDTYLLSEEEAVPPSAAALLPEMDNFAACLESCTGYNAIRIFPEGIQKIYLQWDYENIPIGADYSRSWSMNGLEWIRYNCAWPGPESGSDHLTLREPGGLHSGTWEVTITVDGEVLLQEQLQVEGNWTFWGPAGLRTTCY